MILCHYRDDVLTLGVLVLLESHSNTNAVMLFLNISHGYLVCAVHAPNQTLSAILGDMYSYSQFINTEIESLESWLSCARAPSFHVRAPGLHPHGLGLSSALTPQDLATCCAAVPPALCLWP